MSGTFRPTLAASPTPAEIEAAMIVSGHLLASPKLDGFRCLVRGGRLVSRSLKPIPNRWVNACLGGLAQLEGLDGELVVGEPTGEGVFRRTSSGVTSFDGEPGFAYHVFDLHDMAVAPFAERYAALRGLHSGLGELLRATVRLVPQARIESMGELAGYEEACVGAGYEGVMLRRPGAPYKHGRSTVREGYLMKVKRFLDREAVVLGLEELMHNSNAASEGLLGQTQRSHRQEGMEPMGTLGALRVRDRGPDGRWEDFRVGTGFDAADRAAIWAAGAAAVGRVVKYRYLPVGTVDRPRFPVFLGFRDPIDL